MSGWQPLLKLIEKEYRNNPTEYLIQPTISRCLHPAWNDLAEAFWDDMLKYEEFSTNYMHKMHEIENIKYNPTKFKPHLSMSTIQHTRHLLLMKKYVNSNLEDYDYITEAGGGYGNLCRLSRMFGFKNEYQLIDFPLILEIQKSYLNSAKIKGVLFSELTSEIFNPIGKSIFITTFAMNEMPKQDRLIIKKQLYKYSDIFIVYNRSYNGIDNIKYFSLLADRLKDTFDVTIHSDEQHMEKGRKKAWILAAKNKGVV
ncbi:hypothetical protein LCGC14_0759190 [marine sediment metagenome]|uniref:Sugar O-methyltransferase n=1 Tax=marine sediment metagenome TaxID=412755 RepID=A0A0F9QLM9_9ZZZZ